VADVGVNPVLRDDGLHDHEDTEDSDDALTIFERDARRRRRRLSTTTATKSTTIQGSTMTTTTGTMTTTTTARGV
jgi:hypothetical protein